MTIFRSFTPWVILLVLATPPNVQAAQDQALLFERNLPGTRPEAGNAKLRGEAQVEWISTPRLPVVLPAAPSVPKSPVGEPSAEWTVLLTDRTFSQTLQRWTRTAGWQLVWEVERDFAIDAQVTLQGTFLEALETSMHSLLNTDYPLQAKVNEKTRVLRITRYLIDGEKR